MDFQLNRLADDRIELLGFFCYDGTGKSIAWQNYVVDLSFEEVEMTGALWVTVDVGLEQIVVVDEGTALLSEK